MANTTRRLTDTEVKQVKIKKKEYSLGSYPNLSFAQARKKAQKLRELLTTGIAPKEHRIEQSRKEAVILSNTFENIAIKWLKLKQPNISASYYKAITSRFGRFIYPKLRDRPIHKIYAVDVIEVLAPIAEAEKLETVKKLCRWVNVVMIYAVNTDLIHANPLAGIGKAFNSGKRANLPTLKPEQLPDLIQSLNQGSIKIVSRCLLEWQLHTMCRPGEAAGTRWEEVDIEKEVWIIPIERMKTKRAHSTAKVILVPKQPMKAVGSGLHSI